MRSFQFSHVSFQSTIFFCCILGITRIECFFLCPSTKSKHSTVSQITARLGYQRRFNFSKGENILPTGLILSSSSLSGDQQLTEGQERKGEDNYVPSYENENWTAAMKEVEELRKKARYLMTEATLSETKLRESSTSSRAKKNAELDDIINKLSESDHVAEQDSEIPQEQTSRNIQPLVTKLRTLRLSESKLLSLIDRIHEREIQSSDSRPFLSSPTVSTLSSDIVVPSDQNFNIADTSNSKEYKQYEHSKLKGLIDRIIEAQSLIDTEESLRKEPSSTHASRNVASVLKARLKELKRADEEVFQRLLASEVNNAVSKDESIEDLIRKTLASESNQTFFLNIPQNATVTIKIDGREITGSKLNMTRLVSDIMRIPSWIPSSLLPFVVLSQDSLEMDDLKLIRSQVLQGSKFRCYSWDSIRMAAIFRGEFMGKRATSIAVVNRIKSDGGVANVKVSVDEGTDPPYSSVVFTDIQKRLEENGLADKVQLFLMNDPEWRPGHPTQHEPRPVIFALPKSVVPGQGRDQGNIKNILSFLSLVTTIFTTFAYSVSAYALNSAFFDGLVNQNDLSSLAPCMNIFVGVIIISAIHEIAHIVTARKHELKIGLPIPLPSLQIGTFGNITPLQSFPETRAHLLDFALSGPIAALVVSLISVIVGLFFTIHSTAPVIPTLATVPAALFKSSLLIGTIVSVVAPKVMMLPMSQPVPVHPLFMIGLAGMVASALNLLPIGRLDGGRAFCAVFGRRSGYIVSFLALAFLVISALTGHSATAIFWGFLVSTFQRTPEIPVRDDITEVDNLRFSIYVTSVIFTILVLCPFPGAMSAI